MSNRTEQEWKSRKEIPNAQIKDAADQYNAARIILNDLAPGSGVLLPSMNTAAVAIELYLKSLSAEVIHVPDEGWDGWYTVYAEPSKNIRSSHRLVSILGSVPEDIRSDLENTFKETYAGGESFQDILAKIEGAWLSTRYPYEPIGRRGFDLRNLMLISDFLQKFVSGLKPRDLIQWQ